MVDLLEQLARRQLLERVEVDAPSPAAQALAEAQSHKMFGNGLSAFTCADNACALVEAMVESRDPDWPLWRVVYGLAFGADPKFPTAHVWATSGNAHYDPTWCRAGGNPRDYVYFAICEQTLGNAFLDDARKFARRWQVPLLEDQPFSSEDEDGAIDDPDAGDEDGT